MYVDAWILLAIYLVSVISLGISIYALWTLSEIEDYYREQLRRAKKAASYKTSSMQTAMRKSHWG